MAGLFLNSYPLKLSSEVELHEMAGAARSHTRADLRDLAGVSVWMGEQDAYAYGEPAPGAPASQKVSRALARADALSLWAVREAIIAHCLALGYEARFAWGGELQVFGPIPAVVEDRFRIEHGLHMRVSREEYIESGSILTVRHRARWSCIESLEDQDVAARAAGRRALRLSGDGPAQGWIDQVDGDMLTLTLGKDQLEVPAANYTISVNSGLIAGWRGSDVLRRVRVMTGDLTVTGKRNRHGVEDRFKLVGDGVRKLGEVIPANGGGEIAIDRLPISIRLEGAS